MTDVPFKFGLERVRELRAHDEDRAREEFAASLNRRARGAAMLQAAQDLIEQARDGRRTGAAAGPVPAQDLLGQQLWLERLERHRTTAERELDRTDTELTVRRDELNEARQKREVLERLKDRRRDEHAAENARREGAALDEMALSQHVRKMAGR
ncbi:MAG: flagellar export protein FliJ [Solirubrobacteraceae bacterium]|nr:flagellar export protein FliJ [Solirubrobacteraceae bacterium]